MVIVGRMIRFCPLRQTFFPVYPGWVFDPAKRGIGIYPEVLSLSPRIYLMDRLSQRDSSKVTTHKPKITVHRFSRTMCGDLRQGSDEPLNQIYILKIGFLSQAKLEGFSLKRFLRDLGI